MSESNGDQWIHEITITLGSVHDKEVKACSICRAPEKFREAEDKDKSYTYRPKLLAIGPIHRGTGRDTQITEESKWLYAHHLLCLPTLTLEPETVQRCSKAIKDMGSKIRASYGETIDIGEEELARMMLLDGCFLLEHLIRLTKHEESVDEEMNLRLLTDLTVVDNQIPFFVLTTLSSTLLEHLEDAQQLKLAPLHALSRQVGSKVKLSPENIAESLFKCKADDFSEGVYHFLHLIHLCSPDPYKEVEPGKDKLQLLRGARKLQAFGITITASQTDDSKGNDTPGTVASVLRKFTDKFEFKIEFKERQRELIIPTLHIKETTEVKWRNLIAWEQIGVTGIGYKFTSYAYFFKGLVCSVHDLKLLKDKGVIKVHKEAKDEHFVKMFQSITTGAEQMDPRYRKVCKRLNKAKVNGVAGCCVFVFRMPWHYWRRFLELLRSEAINWLRSFVRIYLGTPWRIVGVVVGAILLALTIMQTVYAARG
ncbi:UPF0481 protein At3g47200-like [Neltuma alba]|uniref:UPF0481 protein At3g47200-like n=1 Tax=Neltuma alba TaxID=207710 RepID=UPI0010A52BC4|nr:UPF0481 protein At3g47200-like [Prosopis alba]